MKDRSNCDECYLHEGKMFCTYHDPGFSIECDNVDDCPIGLDDEDFEPDCDQDESW